MGFFGRFLLVTGVLTVGLGYVLYVPIPDGFSKPWTVQIAYSAVKFMKVLSSVGEGLGLGPAMKNLGTLLDFAARIKTKLTANDDILKIIDTEFDGIPVRVYSPVGKAVVSPGFVYYHGGGWTFGSVDSYDSFVRGLATGTNTVIVSVEYRLAPEHIFPAAFDDCVAATKFFLKNAADFGVNATRVGIGGDSAGGNLAAAVTLKLREDRFSPKVKLQVLIYPAVQQLDYLTPSYQQNQHDTIIGKADAEICIPYYIQGDTKNGPVIMRNEHTTPDIKKRMSSTYMDVKKLPQHMIAKDYVPPRNDYGDENLFKEVQHMIMNPYASPLIADDLSNLPKAYVFTGHNDILRDDGFWYVQRLRDASVEVHHRHSEIAFHGIFFFHDMILEGMEYTTEIINYIKRNL